MNTTIHLKDNFEVNWKSIKPVNQEKFYVLEIKEQENSNSYITVIVQKNQLKKFKKELNKK